MRWDEGKLLKPDSHVYGENGSKFIVYNMKRNPKIRRRRKNREREKFKKYNCKRKNTRLLIVLFRLS